MATEAVEAELGSRAPDFALPGACGQTWSRDDALGPNGLLVMFICNHCPYVQAVLDRIVRDARELQALGVGVVAISSNDAAAYPGGLLRGDAAPVARQAAAVSVPARRGPVGGARVRRGVHAGLLRLRPRPAAAYHGRLDASGRQPAPPGARRELFEAMKQVALGRPVPDLQTPSIGCSIKWKAAPGPA